MQRVTRCCLGSLALLVMRDSGTSTVLTGYESMRLRSLRMYVQYIWGFSVRQHLWSLAPVMNECGWLWWPNYIRGPCASKAPWHLSYKWGKPPKNLTQETCLDRGSNPDPLRDGRSLLQSKRTTTRDPVQHTRWTYPCYRVVNTENQQRSTRWWWRRLPNI